MSKILLTVEDKGINYDPIIQYLAKHGHECKWTPLQSNSSAELISLAKGAEGAIIGMELWDAKVIGALSDNLKIIARYGIGYDNVDIAFAKQCGIAVTNTPSVLSVAVAELSLALYLCLSRKLMIYNSEVHNGVWEPSRIGNNIREKTVGLVGYGSIGKEFSKLLRACSCTVVAYDPYVDPKSIAKDGVRPVTLDELLEVSDCVSIHIPHTDQTDCMVNADFLSKMKRSAFLINTSRGKIVSEDDLAKALRERSIAGAGLDVFRQESLPMGHAFLGLENIILTPHIASSTEESFIKAGLLAAESVCRYLSGDEQLGNRVS